MSEITKDIFFLRESVSFQDGNSVSTEVPIKKISKVMPDDWIKVETVEAVDVKRIFWTKNANLATKKELEAETKEDV